MIIGISTVVIHVVKPINFQEIYRFGYQDSRNTDNQAIIKHKFISIIYLMDENTFITILTIRAEPQYNRTFRLRISIRHDKINIISFQNKLKCQIICLTVADDKCITC